MGSQQEELNYELSELKKKRGEYLRNDYKKENYLRVNKSMENIRGIRAKIFFLL